MTDLGHELRMVQNPALGAVILWRFARAYSEASSSHSPAPLCLAALVLPMVWHEDTARNLASTQKKSGLRAFADKFTDTKESNLDALVTIHERVIRWRSKTLASLRMAHGCGLLRLELKGGILAFDKDWQPAKHSPAVRSQANLAEKLGGWFASLSLLEIATILHVRF